VIFTAQTIVNIITQRRLPLWNEDWIASELMEKTEISIITQRLDSEIQSAFSRTTIPDWVALYLEYPNNSTYFLNAMIKVGDRLICYAESHGTAKLISLLEALPSQRPLPHWILSSAMSRDNSVPTTYLQFIIDPIKQLIEQRSGFKLLIQRLLNLETRFQLKIVNLTDVDWSAPFPTDSSLLWSMNNLSPPKLAKSRKKGRTETRCVQRGIGGKTSVCLPSSSSATLDKEHLNGNQDSMFSNPAPPSGNDTNHGSSGSTVHEGLLPLTVPTRSALGRNSAIIVGQISTHKHSQGSPVIDFYSTRINLLALKQILLFAPNTPNVGKSK
jgi:hypothetical protein